MLKIFLIVLFTIYISIGMCLAGCVLIADIVLKYDKESFWSYIYVVLFWPRLIPEAVRILTEAVNQSNKEKK